MTRLALLLLAFASCDPYGPRAPSADEVYRARACEQTTGAIGGVYDYDIHKCCRGRVLPTGGVAGCP